ncbi:MAG: hypothetical protein QF907_06425 [Nitrospinota bacterium]|jgi:hypothetical protein|nr:hypothetical protein [Nitrospinota bacterium]MDP7350593.1 hypothetical protein [Nitrospinota bacterium]HJN01746.1 hypothetical protein [Nitrospinota bacterium]|tara:strand:+ start:150 stop:383 length:234 start_codon:yes stop_codon:yes gene_type:complete
MTKPDDKGLNLENLSPEEIKFLTANVPSSSFKNCPPGRLEIVMRILNLFNEGKLEQAKLQLAEVFPFGGDHSNWSDD